MDAKEALEKIKTAEQEAEAAVLRAKQAALEILEKAKRKNAALLAAVGKKAETEIAELQQLHDKEVRDEMCRLEKETAAAISIIKEKAAKTGGKALDFIISKLKS